MTKANSIYLQYKIEQMRFFFISLVFILIGFPSIAGTIKGMVTDKNREPLVGATIEIENLKEYTISGLNGAFLFKNVTRGQYQIKVSYVGFKTKTVTVALNDTKSLVRLKIILNETTTSLKEVSISGKTEGNSVAKAVTREKRANNIINVISGQTIRLSPDISVSDVLQKVSGVSLEKKGGGSGSSYAIIRGMPKRYNTTLINGIKIPSPNNKNRYVSMDIFPSDLLARLEVYKTLTPSMEGDAVGGVVDMVMKNAPVRFLFTSDISFGYHDIFLKHPFKYMQTKYIQKYSPFETHGPYYFAKPSDFTTKNMNVQNRYFTPDIRANFTLGNRFLNQRLGLIFSVSYNNYNSGTNGLRFIPSTTRDGTSKPVLSKMIERFYYNHVTQGGVYFMTDYYLNKKNYFKFFSTYLHLNNNQVREETIYRLWGVNANNLNVKTYNDRFRKTTQQIYNATLKGKHQINTKTNLDWTIAFSKARQQRPDNSEFVRVSNYSLVAGKESVLVAEDGDNYRRWEHNSDQDISLYFNFIRKFNVGSWSGSIKSGIFYRDKKRNSFIVTYRFNPDPAIQAYGTGWKPDDSNVIKYHTWEKFSDVTWNVRNPQGTTRDELNYDAFERTGAVYAQFNLTNHNWEMILGARWQKANHGYLLLAPRAGETPQGNHIYTDLLPSIHLKYNLTENSNIRGSWFYSVIMPGYFEIVPYIYAGEDYTELGNPNLKPIHAQNFDLRYGNFRSTRKHFTVGAFYKIIFNPIEYTLENGIPFGVKTVVRRPKNFGKAVNYGIEFDYTQYFRNIGIKINYTYTHSTITTTKSLRARENPNDPSSQIVTKTVSQTRPLQGQADHIGNASVLYKGSKNGIHAQLSLVYTGWRIENVSNFYNNDEWQMPYWTVDFAFDKKIKEGLSAYFKVKNIFNTFYQVVIRQPIDASNAAYPHQGPVGNHYLTQQDYYGRSFRIGLQYKF